MIFQGRPSFNKGYVQILREEKGEALYALFANPSGGPERLSHISSLWGNIQPKSVVKVDTARAYLAAAMDDFEKGVVLLRISHKQAKEYGLSWTLIVGPEEEKLFGGLVVTDENGLKTVRVIHTPYIHVRFFIYQKLYFTLEIPNFSSIILEKLRKKT